MISNKILLTGAGFTHNFGTPLAKEMWCEIFNHEKVQAEPRVKHLMLNNDYFDFEAIYDHVMEGDYTQQEKYAVSDAVITAYENLDSIIVGYFFGTDPSIRVNMYGVQEFVNLFVGLNKNDKSFFFTLNQDLFIERRYYNWSERPYVPGINNNPDWFSSHNSSPLKQTDYIQLPSEDEIKEKKKQFFSYAGYPQFFYIKLHGSQNWKSSTGSQQMVIGRGKAEKIQKEPILSWYFEIFKKVLFKPNRHLLVIGYGFGDQHINETIAEAIEQHGLRLYIISPQPINEFFENLFLAEFGQKIWEGLSGYFPYTLFKMFPGDQSKSQAFRNVKKNFFGV